MKKRIVSLLIAAVLVLTFLAVPVTALAAEAPTYREVKMNEKVTDYLRTQGMAGGKTALVNSYWIYTPGEGTMHFTFTHDSDVACWGFSFNERPVNSEEFTWILSDRAKLKDYVPMTIDIPVIKGTYMINIFEHKYNVIPDPHEEPYEFTCTFTPKDAVAVKSVKLNRTSYTMEKGARMQLKATVSPSGATNQSVTWKSDNTKVATVDSTGKVTAKGNGSANITVTTSDGGKTASCKVTVRTPATKLTLSKSAAAVKAGKTLKLSVTAWTPTSVYPKSITWKSNNTAVATVDKTGLVKAIKPGTAYIYAKAWNGVFAKCKIVVK